MSVSIQWFGRAWFRIETQKHIIHIDPSYAKTYVVDYEKRSGSILAWLEKERADLVLVTHSHADHCQPATIDRLCGTGASIIAPRRCAKKIGGDVAVIKPGTETVWDGITIRAVEAHNTEQGSSTRKGHHKGDGVGYVITLAGKTIYHAGDTDLIPEMHELGIIDVALLPIGGTFAMDVQEAVEAAMVINPKAVIPMHTLKKANPHEFVDKLRARSDIEAVLLQIGNVYQISSENDAFKNQ